MSEVNNWSLDELEKAVGLDHILHADDTLKAWCQHCKRLVPGVREVRFEGGRKPNERWCVWCIGIVHLSRWRTQTSEEKAVDIPETPSSSWGESSKE